MGGRFVHVAFSIAVWVVLAGLLQGCPKTVPVPDITGFTATDTGNAIRAAGLTTGDVFFEYNETIPFERVVRTIPPAGTQVSPGTVVDFVFSAGPRYTTVPNVVGLTGIDAEDRLYEARLAVGVVTNEQSATVASGRVIRHSPTAGTTVESLTSVDLVLSLGPPPNPIVPNVVGQTQSAAQSAITGAGLTVGSITQQSSATVPAGRVISQTPAAGTSVSTGTAVNLVISTGARPTVPDLRGKTQSEATTALTAVNLMLGAVTEDYSTTVPIGRIISHNPVAGLQVNAGSAVAIVISIGVPPIEINDVTELQKIGYDAAYPINGNYVLGNAINASSTVSANGGLGFNPIGDSENRFTGRFDGRGFAITDLTISRRDEDHVGLFGYVGTGASIKNVVLTGGTITGRDRVGALCGRVENVSITGCRSSALVNGEDYTGGLIGSTAGAVDNCSASGGVTGYQYVGGLVGASFGSVTNASASGTVVGSYEVGGLIGYAEGSVTNCEATGAISASGNSAGGLIGQSEANVVDSASSGEVTAEYVYVGGIIGYNTGTLTRCWSQSNVTSESSHVGGLVGFHFGAIIQCVAEGDVQGGGVTGGLVGSASSSATISQSYSSGAVIGGTVGGLVGETYSGCRILQCYAVGPITGSTRGGLVASGNPTVTASFWDIQATGNLSNSQGGTGLTTVQMQAQVNFTAAGWDFVGTWGMDEGISYPYLLWTLDIE